MKTRSYLLLMLVTILVPVAFLSILGLTMLLRFERDARTRSIADMAHSTSLMIDSEIAIAEASINNIANSQDIRTDNFARLHELLTATSKSQLTWTLIADYPGNGLMNTLVPFGTPLAQRSGNWAAEIYDGQKTHVSGYFMGLKAKRGVVSVSVPVPLSGQKKYVVTQIFDPRFFNKVFERTGLQEGWIVGLFDANGISIARNQNAANFVGKPVRAELYEAARRNGSGWVRHMTRDGIDVYDSYVRSEATGWTVAVGIPVSQFDAAARLSFWYAASALIALLGSAVGIAVYFGRRIDQSLNHATMAAQSLAQGGVIEVRHSQLQEANVLLDVLHGTGVALAAEKTARQHLERERAQLMENEIDARRQAEADSHAKDNFISMLSHELRNPLSAISGAIAVIRLPQMPLPKTVKAWEIVERQLRHLNRMLDDLLHVRRVLSGKVTLELDRVNTGSLLRFCVESRKLASPKQHAWNLQLDDAWVVGDKTRLEQVIDNLLINASKFSPEGSPITVKNYTVDGTVVIEVTDAGVGIAAELLPVIFDSLVQGPMPIDRSQGGLGLGLSIARGLVQLHNGSLTAHSDGPDQGSTFTVCMPASAPPSP